MLASRIHTIEDIYALKLSALHEADRKWILRRLPGDTARNMELKLKSLDKYGLDAGLLDELDTIIGFDKYFVKSELDSYIEGINKIDLAHIRIYIDRLTKNDLDLHLLVADYLDSGREFVKKTCKSSSQITDYLSKYEGNRENIVYCIIQYMNSELQKIKDE